jgi:transcriptional regulator with XRE-family HTH domain
MVYHPLPNYIRMYRKRIGLSIKDLSFLLKSKTGSSISRYEHFRRIPSFRARLSLMVIFRCEMEDLFPGEYEKVERTMSRRAQLLYNRVSQSQYRRRITAHKLECLKSLSLVSSKSSQQ